MRQLSIDVNRLPETAEGRAREKGKEELRWLASTKKVETAARVEDKLRKKKDGEVGGVWIVGNVEELEEEDETPHRRDGFSEIRERHRDGFGKKKS